MRQVEMKDISNDAMFFHCEMEINRLHQRAGCGDISGTSEGHTELLFVQPQKYCLEAGLRVYNHASIYVQLSLWRF